MRKFIADDCIQKLLLSTVRNGSVQLAAKFKLVEVLLHYYFFVFRIKMCTEISQKDLTTAHHEMGHIEYFLAYKNQPTIFRAGANPGFHEATGDTISLSVETPSYLKKVGLMKKSKMKEGIYIGDHPFSTYAMKGEGGGFHQCVRLLFK